MRIGIDFGGTKIELVILDVNGIEVYKKRVDTPKSYHAALDIITELVNDAEKTLAVTCSVGIGMPGCISLDTGKVKNSNSTWLNDQPFNDDINERLGRKVFIANDCKTLESLQSFCFS